MNVDTPMEPPCDGGSNCDAISYAFGIHPNCLLRPRAKGHQDCQSHAIAQISRYEVKDDGTVLFDWAEVEALAASKQNPLLLPQAQIMLAIRDGKWKPGINRSDPKI